MLLQQPGLKSGLHCAVVTVVLPSAAHALPVSTDRSLNGEQGESEGEAQERVHKNRNDWFQYMIEYYISTKYLHNIPSKY